MRTWWEGFKHMLAVLFGRAKSKWAPASRRPGQERVEQIMIGLLVEHYGSRGMVELPVAHWNEEGRNHRLSYGKGYHFECSTWNGYVHEFLHIARDQIRGDDDRNHSDAAWWGTVTWKDGREVFHYDGGHLVVGLRRVTDAGFAP